MASGVSGSKESKSSSGMTGDSGMNAPGLHLSIRHEFSRGWSSVP